jgi:hypothetical protein
MIFFIYGSLKKSMNRSYRKIRKSLFHPPLIKGDRGICSGGPPTGEWRSQSFLPKEMLRLEE